jgi:hypothetical protein
MPIAPELRHHYEGPEWEATRERILDRAQHCCERCGVPNRQRVLRCRGWWFDTEIDLWIAPGPVLVDGRPPAERGVKIHDLMDDIQPLLREESRFVKTVLCVCHRNHTPGDDRDDNLAAWCQWCHLDYDMEKHADTRKERKDAKRPLLTAASQDQQWTDQLSPNGPAPD